MPVSSTFKTLINCESVTDPVTCVQRAAVVGKKAAVSLVLCLWDPMLMTSVTYPLKVSDQSNKWIKANLEVKFSNS